MERTKSWRYHLIYLTDIVGNTLMEKVKTTQYQCSISAIKNL